ncbi:MAG: PspC domain-containing protein [Chloroflexi bacterium]|nr:MAG: PspC domain-containing protein [Chloroflexota bacterium]
MTERKRLYKSEHDKWVGGVLGGIGDYIDVDPNLLRIGFLVLTLAGIGSTVPLYLLLWFFMPDESDIRTIHEKRYTPPIDDDNNLYEKLKNQ